MTKKIILSALTTLTILFVSCNNIDLEVVNPPDPNTGVTLDNSINNFVWKGLNSWYNWQTNVPNLADIKDDNLDDYYTFLNGYSGPESLFGGLLYDVGNTDRFSWFIDDYVVQSQQFQGISKSFGFRLQAVLINTNNDIIFYVRYVAPNSPASNAGIKRGDIFNAIDGIILNESNYDAVVSKLSNDSVTLSFVSENGGNLTFIQDKTITAIELVEDPVYFKKVFNNINGKKVGYLVYNAFRSSYNDELNDAFAFLKAENIDELILDLRLNGGGSVLTSAYLASMIYSNAGTDKFADLKFNFKHTNQNGAYDFENRLNVYNVNGIKTSEQTINRLTKVTQLYVLTSSSTASASEMIINGLKAFIPVKVIGTTTYGKNVGSITLYDSPSSDYTNVASANSNHKNAMQPIVFQIFNKLGQSDYTQGFSPDIEIKEWIFWNNILPFGDENEVILKGALDDIRGVASKSMSTAIYDNMKVFDVSQLEHKFEKEMYIDHEFFNN